ncbi:profilin [Aspergillus keveii]|uniref:Profilin n=1 Tax=Aspergillus keveii TaxID=714993 RepID=A0ABR4GE32_9EURO
MSWQSYIDSSLVGSGHIDKAAISSAAGDSIWAASQWFNIRSYELKEIAKILEAAESPAEDQSAVATAQAEGIHVAGERYVVARIDERTIYARSGREGVVIVRTTQAIIIAHHDETQVAGRASATAEALADYLISVGY